MSFALKRQKNMKKLKLMIENNPKLWKEDPDVLMSRFRFDTGLSNVKSLEYLKELKTAKLIKGD